MKGKAHQKQIHLKKPRMTLWILSLLLNRSKRAQPIPNRCAKFLSSFRQAYPRQGQVQHPWSYSKNQIPDKSNASTTITSPRICQFWRHCSTAQYGGFGIRPSHFALMVQVRLIRLMSLHQDCAQRHHHHLFNLVCAVVYCLHHILQHDNSTNTIAFQQDYPHPLVHMQIHHSAVMSDRLTQVEIDSLSKSIKSWLCAEWGRDGCSG